jgi:hypothetical protein
LIISLVIDEAGQPTTQGQVSCTARLGATRLRAAASFDWGQQALCRWLLPAATSGQRLTGRVRVQTDGGTTADAFSATVR